MLRLECFPWSVIWHLRICRRWGRLLRAENSLSQDSQDFFGKLRRFMVGIKFLRVLIWWRSLFLWRGLLGGNNWRCLVHWLGTEAHSASRALPLPSSTTGACWGIQRCPSLLSSLFFFPHQPAGLSYRKFPIFLLLFYRLLWELPFSGGEPFFPIKAQHSNCRNPVRTLENKRGQESAPSTTEKVLLVFLTAQLTIHWVLCSGVALLQPWNRKTHFFCMRNLTQVRLSAIVVWIFQQFGSLGKNRKHLIQKHSL